jgi:hypothetical protein
MMKEERRRQKKGKGETLNFIAARSRENQRGGLASSRRSTILPRATSLCDVIRRFSFWHIVLLATTELIQKRDAPPFAWLYERRSFIVDVFACAKLRPNSHFEGCKNARGPPSSEQGGERCGKNASSSSAMCIAAPSHATAKTRTTTESSQSSSKLRLFSYQFFVPLFFSPARAGG